MADMFAACRSCRQEQSLSKHSS